MEKQINYYGSKMECDKSLSNTNKERGIDAGKNMKEIIQDIKCGEKTMRLVLQFPDEEQDAVSLQKEVRTILITELQKQMKFFSLMKTKGVIADEKSADVIKS